MDNTTIYLRRIKKFHTHVYSLRYENPEPLDAAYIYNAKSPIPYRDAVSAEFKSIRPGKVWGKLWGSAWFRFGGSVPERYAGREIVALIDTGSEACVFKNGSPWLGLTRKRIGAEEIHIKRRVPLIDKASGGENVELLVEAGANGLFGAHEPGTEFTLQQAELVCFNREIWQFALDVDFLIQIAESLPEGSPRRNKVIHGLNQVVNEWKDGTGLDACRSIVAKLYNCKAAASSMTAWSIGHAHLDLGWLWPVRETRRKGGRTFATALRMIEEYPEYRFGASQPQLYAWVKEDYPELYAGVKKAVSSGSWECQGAMWVEPDMNITGGESLVRQCLYGKKFYQEEFGIEVDHLWLPDVFGYSAALPQILKKCGVDYFMTQKISWNETNIFPHHTFYWQGIDGTRILTHFLPTNNYNLNNQVKQLVDAEARFAQSHIQDDFLNLYGTGDGGGGPSRLHIEYGLRGKNLEGMPKVKLATAAEFFKKASKTNPDSLPVWAGELYLELHRGTYTTQAKIKRYNRKLELALRNTEFLSTLAVFHAGAGYEYPKDRIDAVWKDTLLNQFHDILPGSSIAWVYEDAHRISNQNLDILTELAGDALVAIHGPAQSSRKSQGDGAANSGEIRYVVYNTLSWNRRSYIRLPLPAAKTDASSRWCLLDGDGQVLPFMQTGDVIETMALLPSMGYTTLTLKQLPDTEQAGVEAAADSRSVSVKQDKQHYILENELIRVKISRQDGTIVSIFHKKHKRESLCGPANRLMLWEDIPYSWDAWDISSYYRQTTPAQAALVEQQIESDTRLHGTVVQKLAVGNSTVRQHIHLYGGSSVISVENEVEWQEAYKMLRVQAETTISSPEATYEIQYGTVRRPTHENTSWDAAKFEVAGHRFADLSQGDYGFAILNDCKYGHYIRDNVVDLTLLRSPKNPDSTADIGSHQFTFAYMPHTGTFNDSDVLEHAHELNSPPLVQPVRKSPEESTVSFFSVAGSETGRAANAHRSGQTGEENCTAKCSVKIEAVKVAEDGKGLIIRLYESMGRSSKVKLSGHREWKAIRETDLLERPVGRAGKAGNEISLEFSPYEIRTFRLE